MKREELKKEALVRMQMLQLNDDAIKDFEENEKAWKSETNMGILYWLNDEEEKMVKEFEENNNCIVYHLIHNNYLEIGECYSIFYVSQYEDEWEMDRYDIKAYYPFVYVKNIDDETLSEYGSIGIRPVNSGLVREC